MQIFRFSDSIICIQKLRSIRNGKGKANTVECAEKFQEVNDLIRRSGVDIDDFVISVNGSVATPLVNSKGELIRYPDFPDLVVLDTLLHDGDAPLDDIWAAVADDWLADQDLIDRDASTDDHDADER